MMLDPSMLNQDPSMPPQQQDMPPDLIRSITQGIRTGIGRIVSRFRPKRFPMYSESLVELVEKEYVRRKSERQGFELQWRLNLAFVQGNQYLDINTKRNDLTEVPRLTWWEQREAYNQIAPIVETRIARLGRMQPKLALRPASPDLSDASSTRIGMALVDHVDRERIDADQQQDKLSWLEICGTVFEKNTWDPQLGKVLGYMEVQASDESPEPAEPHDDEPPQDILHAGTLISQQVEDQMQPVAPDVDMQQTTEGALMGRTMVEIREGDIRVDVVSPFEIFPDSCYHANIEDCRSIIHARAYPKEEVWERWGQEVEAEAEAESWSLQRQTVAGGGLGYGVGAFFTGSQKLQDHVIVKEYWERPSMMYPEGRLIVVAGNKLLYYSERLPFDVGDDSKPGLPFVKYAGIRKPGCFWGGCIVDRLIAPQRAYNALRNRKAEYLTRVAIGNLIVEENSVVDQPMVEQDGGSPGFIFWIKRGTAHIPRYMENEQLPTAFDTELVAILQEFTQISGVSETTRMSEAPPGVKSGVALNLVIEQDNTRLSHTVMNLETGKVKSAKQWLRLYKQFGTEPRLTKIAGSDASSVDAMYWSASDITSDDIIIQTSAMLSDTPAQRRQMVMDLLQSGLFNDPDTGRITRAGRAKIFELLQWGDWEYGNDMDDLHIRRAESENRQMAMGEMPVPEQYDNEELHIERHVRYMLTDRFQEENERAQRMLKPIFFQHIQLHAQIQMLKQAAMMQQQGGFQG